VVFGCAPRLVDATLLNPAAQAMHASDIDTPIKLWHGFNLVLLLSGITLAVGAVLYLLRRPSAPSLAGIERYNTLAPKHVIGQLARFARKIAIRYTRTLHNGYLRVYLLRIILAAIILFAIRLATGGPIRLTVDNLSPVTTYEVVVAAILIAAVYITVTAASRLTEVVATSLLGYCVCLLVAFYSAPDLAMTQFSIDTLTVVVVVLVLLLPPPFLNFADSGIRLRAALVASSFGLLMALSSVEVLYQPIGQEGSHLYGENAYTLATGKTLVSVMLVEFR